MIGKKNLNRQKIFIFEVSDEVSDGKSLVIFSTDGKKKFEMEPKPHLTAGESNRGH